MKQRIAITLFLLLGIGPAAIAQSQLGEIRGNVIDADSEESLPFVQVYVLNGETEVGSTIADETGSFKIKALPSGTYNVKISFTGYTAKLITNVDVQSNKIRWMKDLGLAEGVVISGYTVEAFETPLIEPEDPSAQTISAKQIENSPRIRDLSGLLSSISSDVKLTDNREISIRGSRPGSSAYFIDGVKQSTTVAPLPGRAIGRVTVYTGGIPASYGDVTGGVVIMETKSYFDLYNQRKAQE